MHRTLLAPGAYVQGPGVLEATGDHLGGVGGTAAYLMGGDTALSVAEQPLAAGIEAAGRRVAAVGRGVDRCTAAAVERHAATARDAGADLVVGAGGGAALDAAKATATRLDAPVVTVPTAPSSDAACSTVSVIYDQSGAFVESRTRDRGPELVLADTQIMAEAPVGLLARGLGDALSTRVEAEAAARSNATSRAGGAPSFGAVALARETHDRLESHGAAALRSVAADATTPALERTVEAVVVLSAVGFESGGLAAAHAFHNGFTAVGADAPHGELVVAGTVAELVLEGREDLLDSVLDLAGRFGVARTFADLGVASDQIDEAAAAACEDPLMANEPVPVDHDAAASALRVAADRLAAQVG